MSTVSDGIFFFSLEKSEGEAAFITACFYLGGGVGITLGHVKGVIYLMRLGK